MAFTLTAALLLSLCVYSSGTENEGCESPQYLKIGDSAVIQCWFHEDFYSVLWFHSGQDGRETPFIKLHGSEKSGHCYISGECDIYPNGSLIIYNVTNIYDGNFTAVRNGSSREELDTYHITVITLENPFGMIQEKKVLLVREEIDSDQVHVTTAKRGSLLKLSCLETSSGTVIWKRSQNLTGKYDIIAVFSKNGSEIYYEGYELDSEGSLVLPEVKVEQEGIFECAYHGNKTAEKLIYEVFVYVPAYPVVEECPTNDSCVIEVPSEGQLTCYVKNIRPLVQLEWNTVYDDDSLLITFTDIKVTTQQSGDVFEISMTSKYEIYFADFILYLPVECMITGTEIEELNGTVTVVLVPEFDDPYFGIEIVYIVVALVLILMPVTCAAIRVIVHRRRQQSQENDAHNEGERNEQNNTQDGSNEEDGCSSLGAKCFFCYQHYLPSLRFESCCSRRDCCSFSLPTCCCSFRGVPMRIFRDDDDQGDLMEMETST